MPKTNYLVEVTFSYFLEKSLIKDVLQGPKYASTRWWNFFITMVNDIQEPREQSCSRFYYNWKAQYS